MSSIASPADLPARATRRTESEYPIPGGRGGSDNPATWYAYSMSSWVHTLAPPPPVPSPIETTWPIPWSAMPAAKMSPLEKVVGLTTTTTGPS